VQLVILVLKKRKKREKKTLTLKAPLLLICKLPLLELLPLCASSSTRSTSSSLQALEVQTINPTSQGGSEALAMEGSENGWWGR
jgi:hypothetical protein